MSVLDTSKNARKFDAARMVQNAIADGGPGAFRQAWQIFRLSLRKRKFTPSEYYDYGMFRPAVWKQVTETFLPENDNLSFSTSLSGAAYQEFEPLFLDKLKFEKWARSMGFPVAETLAVYAAEQPEDGFDWLSSKAEVESFFKGRIELSPFWQADCIVAFLWCGFDEIIGRGRTVDFAR